MSRPPSPPYLVAEARHCGRRFFCGRRPTRGYSALGHRAARCIWGKEVSEFGPGQVPEAGVVDALRSAYDGGRESGRFSLRLVALHPLAVQSSLMSHSCRPLARIGPPALTRQHVYCFHCHDVLACSQFYTETCWLDTCSSGSVEPGFGSRGGARLYARV